MAACSTGRGAGRRRGSSPRWWSPSCCRSSSSLSCGARIRKTWRSRSRSRPRRRPRPPAPPRSSSGSAARRRRRRRPRRGESPAATATPAAAATPAATPWPPQVPPLRRRRPRRLPPRRRRRTRRRGRRARGDAGRRRRRSAEAGGQPRLGGVEHDPGCARPAGEGRVKAEVDIPDLKMHAVMSLRKNTDPSLPRLAHHRPARRPSPTARRSRAIKDIGLPHDAPRRSPAAGCADGRAGEDLRQLLPGRPQPRRRRARARTSI